MPVDCDKADAAALQAMRRGEATPDQQIRAMEWIVGTASMRNGMSFYPGPDGDRDTAFAEGRRFVGNQIVKITNMPLSKFDAPEPEKAMPLKPQPKPKPRPKPRLK